MTELTHAYALTADLVASRRAPRRDALSRQIEDLIAGINHRWKDEWAAPLESTRGLDELSGVLRRPTHAFDILVAVNTELWPNRFRFAVAHGPLDVLGPSGRASDMDGPAFHRAADALARARESGAPFALRLGERAGPAAVAPDAGVAEALAVLHQTLVAGWSPGVARTMRQGRPLDGARPTQAEIAAALGSTQQAVSDAYRRGHVKVLREAEDALRRWLRAFDERTDEA